MRVICDKCAVPYTPTEREIGLLGNAALQFKDIKLLKGKGCAACGQTGYRGRKGLYELLEVTEPIRELVNLRAPSGVIRARALELGMRTLRQDGIRSVLDGETTVEEILKYT